MHIWLYMCKYTWPCTLTQKRMLSILLFHHSTPYPLRQNLSLKPRFAALVRVDGQQALGIYLSHPVSYNGGVIFTGIWSAFHASPRHLNSGPHAYIASILLHLPSPWIILPNGSIVLYLRMYVYKLSNPKIMERWLFPLCHY